MIKKLAIAIWILTGLFLGILVLNYYGNRKLIDNYGQGVYQQNEFGSLGFTQPYINHFNRGNVFYKLGDYEKAREEYQMALNLMPGDPYDCKIRVNYALAYVSEIDFDTETERSQEEIDEAVETIEAAKAILTDKDCAKEDGDGHYYAAQKLYDELNNFEDQLQNPPPPEDTPTPSPDPNASPTPTPTTDPNASPTPTTDPNASPTPTPTTDPNASPTPTTDPNASPTPTTDPNASPTPSDGTPTPTGGTPTPTGGTPTPTPDPNKPSSKPNADATATPTPTATGTPSSAATGTPTPGNGTPTPSGGTPTPGTGTPTPSENGGEGTGTPTPTGGGQGSGTPTPTGGGGGNGPTPTKTPAERIRDIQNDANRDRYNESTGGGDYNWGETASW